MTPLLTVETQAGKVIQYGDNSLVPFAQVWHLRLPWIKGGLIWNRPVSVVLRQPDSQETVIPITDVTRQTIWFLFGLGFISMALALMANRNHGKITGRPKR